MYLVPTSGLNLDPKFLNPSLGTMPISEDDNVDDPAMAVYAAGSIKDLCRPCVDCGLYTGNFCDGISGSMLFARLAKERVPAEEWCEGQRSAFMSAVSKWDSS